MKHVPSSVKTSEQRPSPRIVIVGGGASGLFCATQFPQCMNVRVLEQLDTIGKKVLATGNGRCNLSNRGADTHGYYGDAKFAETVLSEIGVSQTMAQFSTLGLDIDTDSEGRIYPASYQAKSVQTLLAYTCRQHGVIIQTGCTVTDITAPCGDAPYLIQTNQGTIKADVVVLATGGRCKKSLGSTGGGYPLAVQLGHTVLPQFPALVQLTCSSNAPRQLKGTRVRGKLSIELNDVCVGSRTGELLFTDYGLSGICTMELSRLVSEHAATAQPGSMAAVVDLVPWRTEKELNTRLNQLVQQGFSPELTLSGCLPISVASLLAKQAKNHIPTMAHLAKAWRLPITSTLDYEFAQVTCGGVETREVNPHTMESNKHAHLYFLGELLNVDGDCGGYNLQFAWSTAMLAAKNIIENEIKR